MPPAVICCVSTGTQVTLGKQPPLTYGITLSSKIVHDFSGLIDIESTDPVVDQTV